MATGMSTIVLSAPERDDLFAEIYYNEELWAFIERYEDDLRIRIVSHEVEPVWELPLGSVLSTLRAAKRRLTPSAISGVITDSEIPGKLDAVIKHTQETKKPVVVTQNGRAAVVVIDAAQYQKEMDERDIYLAVAQGLSSKGKFTPEEVGARLDAVFSEAEIDEDDFRRGMLEPEADIRAGHVYTTDQIDAHIEAVLNEEE